MTRPFGEDEEAEESPGTAPAGVVQSFLVGPADAGDRLDQYLTVRLSDVSRARVQQLIEQQRVLVDGHAIKSGGKLRAGMTVVVTGEAAVPPLRAEAEDIPLEIVYEDESLAVVNKPAGMMVHAGSGATEDARNRGTLVNALLYHMASLSNTAGTLRPGIVHRLDKQTSGLIVVAKNDRTHRKLGEMFAQRQIHKTYLALVHGRVKLERETLNAPISRDHLRRTRMTTRHTEGRAAITHYRVLQRFATEFGHFTLLEVKIETGRTHQIRVHLSSIGHPVAGDTLYGASRVILPLLEMPASKLQREAAEKNALALERNFLHAAALQFTHPETGQIMELSAPLPVDLTQFLQRLQPEAVPRASDRGAELALLKSKR
ncbi:MAG TPA: RluA family pseudouridine synthase [Acidobacteriaceae bacterium]|nr:RluA family pseudouridine synthase [Acidobacteriaceae bacterium]